MAAQVDIYNMALSQVGTSRFLEGLEEDCPEAEVCNLWWQTCVDELLADRAFAWPFATLRAVLSELTITRTDWEYIYAAPAGMLLARFVVLPGIRNPRPEEKPEFQIEGWVNDAGEIAGRAILCDTEDAELVYTARVSNPAMFPPGFVTALAWRLAIPLAHAIPKDANLARYCAQQHEFALAKAKVAAANEGQLPQAPISSFEAARR